MTEQPRCAARANLTPWIEARCSRKATSETGLCVQHQRVFERWGFIAVYDRKGNVIYMRAGKDGNGE